MPTLDEEEPAGIVYLAIDLEPGDQREGRSSHRRPADGLIIGDTPVCARCGAASYVCDAWGSAATRPGRITASA